MWLQWHLGVEVQCRCVCWQAGVHSNTFTRNGKKEMHWSHKMLHMTVASQSSRRQPRCVHWQTGASPNTWAAALAKLTRALSAHGHARGSQGGSQKGTGQRRLWPCHWSCCRLPRSGNIPHRTRNHWMRRASTARLQLPGRDLKFQPK